VDPSGFAGRKRWVAASGAAGAGRKLKRVCCGE
jgi:hypothetical protein